MEFSTAIQQMVAIARAIGFDAKLVIMDEPTSSLDEREVAVLFDVIRQLKREGVAVIFVSHKLDELYAVCDRVTIMRDGRTVAVSPMAEIGSSSSWPPCSGELAQVMAAGGAGPHAAIGDGGRDAARGRASGVGRRVRDVILDVRGARSSASPGSWAPAAPRPARGVRGRARRRRPIAFAGPRDRSPSPRTPSAPAWASAPRTASSRASCPRCRCART